jgi:CRP-like cAMP-binding protein
MPPTVPSPWNAGETLVLPPGGVLLREGEVGDDVFEVVDGTLEVLRGAELHRIDLVGPGATLGDVAAPFSSPPDCPPGRERGGWQWGFGQREGRAIPGADKLVCGQARPGSARSGSSVGIASLRPQVEFNDARLVDRTELSSFGPGTAPGPPA